MATKVKMNREQRVHAVAYEMGRRDERKRVSKARASKQVETAFLTGFSRGFLWGRHDRFTVEKSLRLERLAQAKMERLSKPKAVK
jgi:hypothetical protein